MFIVFMIVISFHYDIKKYLPLYSTSTTARFTFASDEIHTSHDSHKPYKVERQALLLSIIITHICSYVKLFLEKNSIFLKPVESAPKTPPFILINGEN